MVTMSEPWRDTTWDEPVPDPEPRCPGCDGLLSDCVCPDEDDDEYYEDLEEDDGGYDD